MKMTRNNTPVIALAGNPNVGKTTLFNALTGSRQTVGNWPGVTVEHKSGSYSHKGVHYEVVDLPGIYSLSGGNPDELVARDFILNAKPDLIINIVDASNLERNLYLTI
ncbi:MAG: ferrous iron transport protein B, partial [Candidatus Cloacimonetes bacterium]|nr:ferrous iron transport protein B [Candidatus Cloacimonadota bacterium]